jgi:hypothetical protein
MKPGRELDTVQDVTESKRLENRLRSTARPNDREWMLAAFWGLRSVDRGHERTPALAVRDGSGAAT